MSSFDCHAPFLPEILSLHGKWKARKPAVITEHESLSWQDFEEQTNRIAHALIAQGITRTSMVGVIMNNSLATVCALIGIMKAGAASVPINLSVTDDALFAMLDDAAVKAVITTPAQEKRLAPYCVKKPHLLHLTAHALMQDFSAGHDTSLPSVGLLPTDPLNVIYSSGTTGMPKGIVHTHQGRRDWAYDLAVALRYHGGARTLFTIGLYSNISWVSMLCTLLAGGTMIVQESFAPDAVLKVIPQEKISHFSMVPIQLQRMLEHPACDSANLTSVQAIMSCGSPLHADLKKRLFDVLGPRTVIELFGLTEGLITTLDPEEAEGRMASVGKPLIGTDIKIIGDDDTEVPMGTSGEIVGIGRIVMPGYLNRPDATLEATWTAPNGMRWLRTGDIGYLDEDGYLYIVDRKKDMILSGGQNIYPQDLEAVLVQHPGVSEAAVIGIKSETWGETPLAVVVRRSTHETLDDEALRQWANERLGKQQRISKLVFTESLPRNPNGKILKRELRTQYQ